MFLKIPSDGKYTNDTNNIDASSACTYELPEVDSTSIDEIYEIWHQLIQSTDKPKVSQFSIQNLLRKGLSPRDVLRTIYPYVKFPDLSDNSIFDLISIHFLNQLCEQERQKLPYFNTFKDAAELIRKSKKILVLTGAGVSVNCGIPDFRSSNGIYARLHKDFPELPDPQSMFDINFFRQNPVPFYNFAKEIFPGQFVPSLSHMFIKFLEENNQLLRNYTQNIDTLEKVAGIENVVECHGSFSRSTCLNCKKEIDSEEIRIEVMAKRVALCGCGGVLKPNIVFFGEDLHEDFHSTIEHDSNKLDLLIVIGSSLQVRPVASIPYAINPSIPQILINKEELQRYQADIKLLGDSDNILVFLAKEIGGDIGQKMDDEVKKRISSGDAIASPFAHYIEKATCEYELPDLLTVSHFKKFLQEPPRKRSKDEAQLQSNFISIPSKLPSINSMLFIEPNLTIFKGAEFYYDQDMGTFVSSIHARPVSSEDESSSSAFSSTESNVCDDHERRSSSEPPPEHIGGSLPDSNLDHNRTRGSSCPPSFGPSKELEPVLSDEEKN